MATITHTDYLLSSGVSGLWVRLRNNSTSTDYYATAITDALGAFTHSAPPGDYSLYWGTAATVPGTPNLRSSHYAVPVTAGDDIAAGSVSAVASSPYAPNLPGAPSIPTPAGVTTGQLWDYKGYGVNVKAFNAKGDGVTDDRAAIVLAQATGQPLIFGVGNFAVSSYIDINASTRWNGAGLPAQISTVSGTVITATGANSGVIRYRPGTIGNGNPVSGENNVYLEGIVFNGGATTGHLVFIARIIRLTCMNCAFNNTIGTGLKDDLVTAIAAAGVYLFGCEVMRFIACDFENNLNATGNGGAGLTLEKNTHVVSCYACHFNGNKSGVRLVDIDNGNMQFHISQFIGGLQAIYSDIGGWYGITLDTCWCEQQTAAAGAILNSPSGANASNNLIVRGCTPLKGTGALNAFIAVNLTGAEFSNNYYQTWASVYNLTGSGFVEYGNYSTGVTATFLTAAVQALFNMAISPGIVGFGGILQVPGRKASKVIAITYAATMNIDPALADVFYIHVTNGTAFTLTISATDFIGGQRITLVISNESGGAMGVITWPGAFFRVATDWTNPANGKRRSISWVSDPVGSNYVQDGPASGDM